MNEDIFRKLLFSKVELWSLNVSQRDLLGKGPKTFTASLTIEPEVIEDSETLLIILCTVNLNFGDDGPLDFNIKLKVRYKKREQIDWATVYKSFDIINQPILAEASRLISNMCNAMRLPPLIFSPREMLDAAKKSKNVGDNKQ